MSSIAAPEPGGVVLDAGPLIALLHRGDPDHSTCLAGFRQLTQASSRLIVPLPIVFEVFKWLLYEAGPAPARFGLERMRASLDILYPGPTELAESIVVLERMRDWAGTLEDALVAVTGLKLGAPVWTLNYRDLSAFPNLRFWTPG